MRRKFAPIIEKFLGEILVERNVISPRDLQSALERQKKGQGKHKYIGEILFEMGVPQEKINEALDVYDKRKPIGQILLDLKVITRDQLQEGLEKQSQLAKKGTRIPLGRLLVEMKCTTYEGYLEALSRHFNMPIISLADVFPSSALQKTIGEAFALKHKIVVLADYPMKIKLVLSEPSALLLDELRRTFPSGKRVEFYLANPFEVDSCLRKKFDPFSVSNFR